MVVCCPVCLWVNPDVSCCRLHGRYRELAPHLVPLDYTNNPDIRVPLTLIISMPELKVRTQCTHNINTIHSLYTTCTYSVHDIHNLRVCVTGEPVQGQDRGDVL